MNNNSKNHACDGCSQKFRTLTRLRTHSCPTRDTQEIDDVSLDNKNYTSYSGVIETWMGKTQVTYENSVVSASKPNEMCALCGADAVDVIDARIEWIDQLCEQRSMTPPIGRLQMPLCVKCCLRVDVLNEGEKEYGIHNEDTQGSIDEERTKILDEIELGAEVDTALEYDN